MRICSCVLSHVTSHRLRVLPSGMARSTAVRGVNGMGWSFSSFIATAQMQTQFSVDVCFFLSSVSLENAGCRGKQHARRK